MTTVKNQEKLDALVRLCVQFIEDELRPRCHCGRFRKSNNKLCDRHQQLEVVAKQHRFVGM